MLDLATVTAENAARQEAIRRGAIPTWSHAPEKTIDWLVKEIERLQAENLTLRGCHCEEARRHPGTVQWYCVVHGAMGR